MLYFLILEIKLLTQLITFILKDEIAIFEIHGAELKWFEFYRSYLTKTQQVCFVNGHVSSPRQIICGVPQGSIPGPLLFVLYTNDMPRSLKSTTPFLYTRKILTTCSKSADEPLTSCVRTACYKLSTSLEQVVNNL